MGIQKTNLDNKKIKNIMQEQYNINALKITRIDRGTSNIFKVESNMGEYILKEFVSKRKKETILKEINIIDFLQNKGLNVPTYVKTVNSDFYTEYEGRIIIVQRYIQGYVIEDNTGEYKDVIKCANVLGKLTKVLMDFPELSEENIIEEQFSKNRIYLGIEKMEQLKNELREDNEYKEQIKKDISYKIKIAREFKDKFDFEIIKKLTMLNSHGDFCTQQLIYHDKEEPTIIDFEKAKRLPIVWEIMRSYSYVDKDVKEGKINIDTLLDYFKEFNKYVSLNKYDLKYASYIYLLQLIGSTYGYKEYNNDYGQKELLNFAFFRTKLCRNLYENAGTISRKLSENIKSRDIL